MGGGFGSGSNPLFEPFMDSLRVAVPLVINQRRLDAEKEASDKAYNIRAAQILAGAQEAKQKVAAESAYKIFEESMKNLDPANPESVMRTRAAGLNMEKIMGMEILPRDEAGEPTLPGLTWKQSGKENEKISQLGQLMKERDLLPEGDPRRKAYDDAISKYSERGTTKVDINTTNVMPGNQPAEKTVRGALQKDIVDTNVQLNRLKTIKSEYSKEFLQATGKMKGAAYKFSDFLNLPLEKLPGFSDADKRKFLGQRTRFITQVEQLFNLYRKDITGAAASVQELDRLKKSMMNADMTPMEFEEAYKSFESNLKRALRIKNKVLREGFDVRDESTGGQAFDRAFLGGGDDDVEVRGAELEEMIGKRTGLTGDALKKQVAKQLESEGYFD